MLVFLYGSDRYRLKQAKNDLVNRHKAKYSGGMDYFYFDLGEQADISQLQVALKSSSFFNEHKLIVCKNVFGKKTTAENMTAYIKDYSILQDIDITIAVLEGATEKELTTKNKELFKLLCSDKSIVKNIEPLPGALLLEWVLKEFEIRNCTIQSDVARKLVAMVGNDSWSLINEIHKLSTYRKGDITDKDVNLLVSSRTDSNIFYLTDALALKDNKRFIELLYYELKTGRDSYYILTMIIYQLRNLIAIKDLQNQKYPELEIAKKSQLHPFVVKKALKSPFRLEEAILFYNNLLSLDIGFKTGNINLENSLYGLIVQVETANINQGV